MKINDFLKALSIRAVRTGAQTLLSFIAIGMAAADIDWKTALSVTLVAMLASALTSVVTGLPEAPKEAKDDALS